MYDEQIRLKRECEDEKSDNSREDNGERRPSDSAKPKSLITPVESGGKTQGVKKVSLCVDNSVEKLKKQPNFYAKKAQFIFVFFTNKPMILLVYKEAYFNTNYLDYAIPSMVVSLLQEFDNILPEKTQPHGLYICLYVLKEPRVDISMDFILGLPKSKWGRDSIFIGFQR